MQNLTTKKNKISKLSPEEIEAIIIDNLGIKVKVIKNVNFTFILLDSYKSCFTIMERFHWHFDFTVHKKNNKYIIKLCKNS